MNPTLDTLRTFVHNTGIAAAPVAMYTQNHLASVITVVSSVIILLPKVVELLASFRNIFKKH